MSVWSISEVRLTEGVVSARLSGPEGARPSLRATHLGAPVDGLEVSDLGGGAFDLRLRLPDAMLSDGVQTLLILDAADDTPEAAILGSLTLVAGDVLAEDIRAEIDLLREELDMLKRAFRRHAAGGED